MVNLEQVRSALLATDPFEGIDTLIRSELSAGRTTKQIFNDLNPLVDVLRATPDLPEDGEEALFGALDALLGHCHRDSNYTDPPIGEIAARPVDQPTPEVPQWPVPK